MALEQILTDGTETGNSAAVKINAGFNQVNTNIVNIQKNIDDIVTNGNTIATNTADIATNTQNILTNTQSITDIHTKITSQTANFSNLPTTDPLIVGDLWNNAGVLNISAG